MPPALLIVWISLGMGGLQLSIGWRRRSGWAIVQPETVIVWHRKGFSSCLDVEGPSRRARKTHGSARSPRPYPQDEPRQPSLGRTPHPR